MRFNEIHQLIANIYIQRQRPGYIVNGHHGICAKDNIVPLAVAAAGTCAGTAATCTRAIALLQQQLHFLHTQRYARNIGQRILGIDQKFVML